MLNPRIDARPPMNHIWNAALRLNRPAPKAANPNVQNADYQYHKFIVDGFVNGLRAAGAIVITEVDLVAVNGLTARADFMGMLPTYGGIVMTEVKTSLVLDDYDQFPGLPRFQADVYRLVPMGGHVSSPNFKVSTIGLAPSRPFPPMRLHIIRAILGLVYNVKNFDPGSFIALGEL